MTPLTTFTHDVTSLIIVIAVLLVAGVIAGITAVIMSASNKRPLMVAITTGSAFVLLAASLGVGISTSNQKWHQAEAQIKTLPGVTKTEVITKNRSAYPSFIAVTQNGVLKHYTVEVTGNTGNVVEIE